MLPAPARTLSEVKTKHIMHLTAFPEPNIIENRKAGNTTLRFIPYVLDQTGLRIPVSVLPMTQLDAERTDEPPEWQTSWMSDYLADTRLDKVSVKRDEELIA